MFFYESSRFGENYEFSFTNIENFNFPVHLHRCFEFVYVTDGQIIVNIDNETKLLNAGEMVLIFPNQSHSYETKNQSKGFIYIFSPEYVNLFYQHCKNKAQENIITKLDNVTNEYILNNMPKDKDNIFLIKSCLYAICADIFKKTKLIDIVRSNNYILQHNILSYIENNFTNEISLKIISNKFGYNYQYLSRYFNSQFKMPFSKMLNEYRINYAAYLTQNSDMNFTEIAYSCGYKSIRSFNRNFYDIMNKTPSEYR